MEMQHRAGSLPEASYANKSSQDTCETKRMSQAWAMLSYALLLGRL